MLPRALQVASAVVCTHAAAVSSRRDSSAAIARDRRRQVGTLTVRQLDHRAIPFPLVAGKSEREGAPGMPCWPSRFIPSPSVVAGDGVVASGEQRAQKARDG